MLLDLDASHRVLFAHVPKTGGTAVRHGRRAERLLCAPPGCERLTELPWYLPLPPGALALPSFGVMRDPFDRAESCWRDFRHTRHLTLFDFDEFLDRYGPRSASRRRIADPRTPEHHMAKQTDIVHGLQCVRHLLRYESLQSDLDAWCHRHGLPVVQLERRRVSMGPRVTRTTARECAVRYVYADDYELLSQVAA